MAELEIRPTAAMRARVVALIAAGIGISALLMYLLLGGGEFFARRTTLTTYRSDSGGLNEQSEVRLGGIQIGQVEAVDLSGALDPERTVRVKMSVLRKYLQFIPADSQIDVNSDTPVDLPFIEIDEGKSTLPISDDSTLPSKPAMQITDRAAVIENLQQELAQVDQMLVQMSSPDTQLGRFVLGEMEYDKLLSRVNGFDSALRSVLTPRSDLGKAFFSLQMYNDIRKVVEGTDNMLASIQSGKDTAGRLFNSTEDYDRFLQELKTLHTQLADINAGRGQLGPMLNEDESYRKIARLLAETDHMISSLNAGEGQFGRLLENPQLYESLNGSLRNMQSLLHDFRDNPQKYLRYKVF